jgi:hypothetical protein
MTDPGLPDLPDVPEDVPPGGDPGSVPDTQPDSAPGNPDPDSPHITDGLVKTSDQLDESDADEDAIGDEEAANATAGGVIGQAGVGNS